MLQISIAMAAIALLTQRKWLVWGVYGLGALGSVHRRAGLAARLTRGPADATRDLERQFARRAPAAGARLAGRRIRWTCWCLQETKLTDDKFPHAEIEAAGYRAQWHGQKTYNGVALLSRGEADRRW